MNQALAAIPKNNFVFDFRSIRSNNGLFRSKLEAQTDPRGPIFAKFHVLFQLGVDVPDFLIVMPHPKTFEVLWNGVLTDMGEAKTPKSMRSTLQLIEYC